TIDVNLKEISARTLGLGTYTISGPKNGETTAVGTNDLTTFFGADTELTTTTVSNATDVTDAVSDALDLTSSTVASNGIVKDSAGSWYNKVTVTVSAADAADLAEQGFVKE